MESENKIRLSIAIPTWNRSSYLKNLLECIAPQAKELEGLVEICISNNGSTDNTREVVMDFKEKYPGLIRYNENEKNLGFDRNMLKAMEMSEGNFVWLLGDDDMVVNNGIRKVNDFVKNYCNKNTGLIALGREAYFIDNKTGKKVVYSQTIEKSQPEIYKINRENVIRSCFPDCLFISVLLFNNKFLKKILEEEKEIIEKTIGTSCIHAFLYRLMFLKYSEMEAIRFNEKIIEEELHYYKFYIEDIFWTHYVAWRKFADLLLSSKYINDYYGEMIVNDKKGWAKGVVVEMGVMKGFKAFDYLSFFGCIKTFFEQAVFADALLLSLFFAFFSVAPSSVLKNLYKSFLKARYKDKWQKIWFCAVVTNSDMSKGSRRLIC